jgi:UDPglucose--hexose-1-phosphate uridylyltransferase
MHKRSLKKPDGRDLWLYSRQPIALIEQAPSPVQEPTRRSAHMRWHPLREEWVAYASHRQNRTFLPPAEYNPLAPTTDPAHPTELPAGEYDVAVFQNLFPTFSADPGGTPQSIVDTRPAAGAAEVVVFTQDASASLGALPLSHLELLSEVWTDRYRELGARRDVEYVLIFENRGVEVGVTLHHPHGQIYAYPFVPPIPARELAAQQRYYEAHGRGLLESVVDAEIKDGRRILSEHEHALAFMPAFARYSYEVWIAPRQPVPSLTGLDASTRADLARALKLTLLRFDRLWHRPFPYVMVFHQAPTDGLAHPEAHLHIEFYPAFRMPGRLKYLAGSELGAGVFTADTLPEEKAAELRAVQIDEADQ